MKKLVVGVLAHVDAGKTTLSEALLYTCGSIKKVGRVDNRDSFLDIGDMEKERGITIFSKQAEMVYQEMAISLLDTPGHVDFCAETERTLQVLDYAVLVISGADGVQSHTRTLWRLLGEYGVPVFLYINKMDRQETDKDGLLCDLQRLLSVSCVDFSVAFEKKGTPEYENFLENAACCDEAAMDEYLESGKLPDKTIAALVKERKLFPCFFGSALKLQKVEELLRGLLHYTEEPAYGEKFAARVYKIARDEQGVRLTYLKVTGGTLRVRDVLRGKLPFAGQTAGLEEGTGGQKAVWEEKVTQIRLYSGKKYETADAAPAGTVCAVAGPKYTYPGQGFGEETESEQPLLEPVLTCKVIVPPETDAASMLGKLKLLEEEEPQLSVLWDEQLKEIQVRTMGEVQLEILQRLIYDRFQISVEFGPGSVIYKETIASPVIGVGHFEPLRHYAEVHLRLEPAEPGSGLSFATACSEDALAVNWQRLVLTHLEEKIHKGVLTGAPLTDMRITLVAGRAHLKHTEGGDFRQATYRAVRQGLMEAESVLLEPYYSFRITLPDKLLGRAMTDMERLSGILETPQIADGTAVLSGAAPVSTLQGYQKELTSYSGGLGHMACTLKGYYPCHNAEKVIEEKGYDAEADAGNPSGSVFCAHGAGFVVPWYEVRDYMHLKEDFAYGDSERAESNAEKSRAAALTRTWERDMAMGVEEVDAILNRAYGANKRSPDAAKKGIWRRQQKKPVMEPGTYCFRPVERKQEYLLVDGYNVIFAWEELNELAKVTLDGARGKLLDILCDYQGQKGMEIIVVFDAYRVKNHQTEAGDYYNIHVVYTGEAETADQYIEKFAHENGKKYQVTVATSDGLEQIIIRGAGCRLLSSRELEEEIKRTRSALREQYKTDI